MQQMEHLHSSFVRDRVVGVSASTPKNGEHKWNGAEQQ